MKKSAQVFLMLFAFVSIFAFSSCQEKTTKEKIKDGIENVGDDIEEGVEEVEDEIDDATVDK